MFERTDIPSWLIRALVVGILVAVLLWLLISDDFSGILDSGSARAAAPRTLGVESLRPH